MAKITKANKNVERIILGLSFILAFLFVINPLTRSIVAINAFFLGISLLVYRSQTYQKFLIGFGLKNGWASIGYALLFGFIFIFGTLFIPGLSIGYPILPQSIADSLKGFFVVIVAPIAETIFFQGALMAYVREYNPKNKWIAILAQAFVMSPFHLGAYIAGFYLYPGFASGLSAVYANISSFIVVFVFATIAGWFVLRDGIKNLMFVALFHLILNFYNYALATAVFAIS